MSDRDALSVWAANLIARVDSPRSGAADHPSEIVGRPLQPQEVINIAVRAFKVLVEQASRVAPRLTIYFVVELGSEEEEGAGAARDLDELDFEWLRSVVTDDLDLVVGASGADATFGDAEVRTTSTRQSILTTIDGTLTADIHEFRYAHDPAWTIQARVWWQQGV